MKTNMILDYGHRVTTPGKRTIPLPRVIHERTFNEGYGRVAAELFRQAGCAVLEVAPDPMARMNENSDLNQRIAKANQWARGRQGDCYYLSCHANAGGGQGAEIWIYSQAKKGGLEETLAQRILDKLCKATGMKNRGVKRGYPGNPSGNFAVNRDTIMPAMLIECGFMDYAPEAQRMDDLNFWKLCGQAVYDGMAECLGLQQCDLPPVQPEPQPSGKLYQVQFGWASAGDKTRAVTLGRQLQLEPTLQQGENGLFLVNYPPMSQGDKQAVEQLGRELQVNTQAVALA